MKVVHLSNTDIRGGASRAGYGIKNAVALINSDTAFLAQRKFSTDQSVHSLSDTPVKKQLTNARMLLDLIAINLLTNTHNGRFSFAQIGKDVSNLKIIKDADLLHLHWINEGFLSFNNLWELVRLHKPTVWTFHDMWAFTGGCHYTSGCIRYKESCGLCPYLKNPGENDFSKKIWYKKAKLYEQWNLKIVTPSWWLRNSVLESSLFRSSDVSVIPYAIDADMYKPMEKLQARAEFNLPQDKILMLFGTMSTGEVRKGYSLLINALKKLHTDYPELKDVIEVLVVGAASPESAESLPYKVHYTGRLYSEEKLVYSYNAADFFIAPSLQDNYPNTVMESLSCGVPVVAFNIGGMPDMITNQKNGLLVDEVNSEALSMGIKWMIDNCKSEHLQTNARIKITSDNLPQKIADQYLNLYRDFVNH